MLQQNSKQQSLIGQSGTMVTEGEQGKATTYATSDTKIDEDKTKGYGTTGMEVT